jgi:hypothetical protein
MLNEMSTERPYLASDWMDFRWSAWMPLMAAHPLALVQLPTGPGPYRVRRRDRQDRLEWIGWAERGVREVVERLSRQVHLPVEPYDDPSSPALALWGLRRKYGVAFEVSGAAYSGPSGHGEACESALREAYRLYLDQHRCTDGPA